MGALALLASAMLFRNAMLNATRAPAALTLVAELLALGGAGRLVAALARVSGRLRLLRDRRAVRLDPDALHLSEPNGAAPTVVPRRQVTRVVVAGPESFPQVHVATRSAIHPVLSFPVRAGHSAADLCERLLRWPAEGGEVDASVSTDADADADTDMDAGDRVRPSKRYDDSARGEVLRGDLALPSSWRWLARGPWFALLLVFALSGALARRGVRLGSLLQTGIVGYLTTFAVLGVVLMSAGWVVVRLRRLAPRAGLVALLTPAELITRQRGGVRRLAWRDVEDVSVRRAPRWTPLLGRLQRASIIVRGVDDKRIELPEDELGWPVERALTAVQAYRAGLGPASAPADAA